MVLLTPATRIFCLALTAVILYPALLTANETISNVEIKGLNRTDPMVVHRELLSGVGSPVVQQDIDKSCQRLRNLQIFATVTCKTVPSVHSSGVTLLIEVDERWTTIPIFKYSAGGGATQLILGAYDINVFGLFQEYGGQYEKNGTRNSGVIWYRDRRFLNKRLELFLNFWSVSRQRTLYNIWGKENKIEGGYMLHRRRAVAYLQKEWFWWLRTGAGISINNDKYTEEFVPDNIDGPVEFRGTPSNADINVFNLNLILGEIDYNSFLQDGILNSSLYEVSREETGSDHNFFRLENDFKYFRTLPASATIGFRLGLGLSNVQTEPYMFYLGGLDRIRGFKESRFRAKNYWLTNLEYRIPSYKSRWFVLQHILFYDATGIALSGKKLAQQSAASVGMGIRLISPKVYRLVLRLDYAHPIHKDDETPISFGVQQFF